MPFTQQSPFALTVESAQASAPAVPGVYGLVNSARWIYVGQTDNIQGELLRHLLGAGETVLKWGPTGFVFEACRGESRELRVSSLLKEYRPICNIGATGRSSEREKTQDKSDSPLRFVLKGFSQNQGIRQYDFEGIAKDWGRSQFSVQADLNLVRTYGIPMQELPLLCLELLERCPDLEPGCRLVFTEGEMRQHRDQISTAKTAAAQKKKPPRRPASTNLGSAWRPPIQTGAVVRSETLGHERGRAEESQSQRKT